MDAKQTGRWHAIFVFACQKHKVTRKAISRSGSRQQALGPVPMIIIMLPKEVNAKWSNRVEASQQLLYEPGSDQQDGRQRCLWLPSYRLPVTRPEKVRPRRSTTASTALLWKAFCFLLPAFIIISSNIVSARARVLFVSFYESLCS